MTPNANIDIFRKHYEDMIDCKNAINTNAETLNSNEENAIEALIPIINEYGREMVKKLVVNAVLQNRQNYNEHIRKWADNAIIAQFIFETDNVLYDYIPDHLSEAAIERIAEDIMDKEKNKQTIKSVQGTEYEVLMCSQYRSLLSITNPDNMTAYCTAIITPRHIEEYNMDFDDSKVHNLSLLYTDALNNFKIGVARDEKADKVGTVLDEQYKDFKEEMLGLSREEIYDSCYKIAAVEDVYFHLSENVTLTEAQQDHILASEDNFLKNLAMDWYEYGDTSQELSDYISKYWEDYELEDEGEEME